MTQTMCSQCVPAGRSLHHSSVIVHNLQPLPADTTGGLSHKAASPYGLLPIGKQVKISALQTDH